MDRAEPIKSAARALEVFELFSERRQHLTVGEIANTLGYPQSSTSVLLRSLKGLGYLHYIEESRSYSPTYRIILLGSWLQDALPGSRSILKMMEDLREASGCTVVLGVKSDANVRYASVFLGNFKSAQNIRIGTLRPICLAACGKVLVARMSDPEISRLIRRVNSEGTFVGGTPIDPQTFLAEMQAVRSLGYAETVGAVTPGRTVLAMRLPGPPDQPPMAIGIGAPSDYAGENKADLLGLLSAAIAPYISAFETKLNCAVKPVNRSVLA
jgi:DNA-binding IclR family transcriptional regulator